MGRVDDYATLYRQYLPRILNYIRLRVREEDLAQDLTSAVFERAVAKQHTLRKRDAFGGWIFAIARNVVAGHFRRSEPTVPLDRVEMWASLEPSPTEAVLHREALDEMLAAVGSLSDREQEIVRLKFAGGLGNKEIASILHLRAGHVAVILYRALRKLQRLLHPSDLVEGLDERTHEEPTGRTTAS